MASTPCPLSFEALAVGDRARVRGFAVESDYSRQLKRLGLVEGTEFEVSRYAPLGDPVEIRFRGFSLTLRRSEAQALVIERL